MSEAEVARFAETVERLAGELRRSAIGLDEGGAQALSARAAVMSVMFQYADAGQAFSNRLAHVRSLAIALPEKNEREVMSHG